MSRCLPVLLGALAVLAPALLPAANQPPETVTPLPDRTLQRGSAQVSLDVAPFFRDPDVTGTAVRLTVRVGTLGTGFIDLALFDQQTPMTVANFLAYINAGRYQNNIIHRMAWNYGEGGERLSPFVMQGGGFRFLGNSLDPVPTFPTIQNEPGISNLRGTVAMAKVGSDPDSATSQWFINMSDDNVFLDEGPPVSNLFTVFGRVLGNGMDFADDIADLPIYNLGSPFDEIPLTNANLTNINQVVRPLFVETNAAVIPALTFTVVSSNASLVTASLTGSVLKFKPSTSASGTANLTVTATDLDGATFQDTFTVTVTAPGAVATQPPAGTAVVSGGGATITAGVSGNPTGLQWQRLPAGSRTWVNLTNDGTFSGVDTPTLTITGATGAMHGDQFRLVVANGAKSLMTRASKLDVAFAPQLTLAPVNLAVKAPGAALFKALANGNPKPTFSWETSTDDGATWTPVTNGAPFSGATTANLKVVTNASLHGRQFRVLATNSVGTATSAPVTLAVTASPKIIAQSPATLTGNEGAALTLTVSATGNPAPTFQWKKNNVVLPGETGPTLTLDPLGPGHAATYTVVALNGVLPNATSKPIKVVVAFAPQFTLHPANAAVKAPGAALFKVAANGNPKPTFSWETSTDGGATWTPVTNGAPFSGATTAILKVATNASLHGRMFRAIASNSAGATTSNPATLAVTASPKFTLQPAALTTVNQGGTVTLSAAATGNPAPTFQWKKNNVILPGETGPTLTLNHVGPGDGGTYTVVASNGVLPNATSKPAKVVVNFAPVFSLQPANATARERAMAMFRVTAKGLPVATTYQWQFSTDDGATWENVSNGGGFTGATTAMLRVTANLFFTGRQFRCVASNSTGATTSHTATLTVTPVPAPAR